MYGFILDNSFDSVYSMAVGIWVRFTWWLNPYIACYCYYRDTGKNYPGTKTFVAILIRITRAIFSQGKEVMIIYFFHIQ